MDQLVTTLDLYFGKKAPALPKNAKEVLVKIAPWLVIIGLVMSLPALLALLGWSGVGGMMWGMRYGYGGGYWLSLVFLGVTLVLQVMALPGLFDRKKMGWTYTFYASLVSVVHNIFLGDWGSLIIGTLISWYILFQVRSYYK